MLFRSLKKKTKAGGITIPDFSLYYKAVTINPDFSLYHKAVIIKTSWYWHKNRHIDQWHRTETPELDPQKYGQLIFDKAGKNIQWKKDSLFNKWFWENWTATCRRMKLAHFHTPFTKTNSKWIKDMNVRQETIKTLEEKAGKDLSDLSRSNFLLDTSPRARELKAKMNYWDLMKIKTSALQRKQSTKLKGNQWNGKRYLQMTYQTQG